MAGKWKEELTYSALILGPSIVKGIIYIFNPSRKPFELLFIFILQMKKQRQQRVKSIASDPLQGVSRALKSRIQRD